MKIYPFILAGGDGQRLFPYSTPECPKPFLPVFSKNTMLQETVLRLNKAEFQAFSLICNAKHYHLALRQLNAIGSAPERDKIILEAKGNGTAFATAVAALSLIEDDPEALLLFLPSDHYFADSDKMIKAVKKAGIMAKKGQMVVFGVSPDRPETEYGYIKAQGENVTRFTEKPDEKTARQYINEGNCYWNAGLFLFPAQRILDELEKFAPNVLKAAKQSWGAAEIDNGQYRLPEQPLETCANISIDYAVLEKARDVKIVPLETLWSDLGSWAAIESLIEKNADITLVDELRALKPDVNTKNLLEKG